jgi:predicted nucleotidyltransferase
MIDKISDRLQQLALEEQIVILYACESGSRAWGFPSPDSDYDVRFIYLRSIEWYLSIEDRRDTIDLPVDKVLDLNGWDLRKALKLFKGSNSVIYEWIQSPIVYTSSSNLTAELLALANSYYSPRAGIHHYLNMATNCYQESLQSEPVKLKKYFYAIRPSLAARWIVEHRTVPPMVLSQLLSIINDRPEILAEIDRLLTLKQTAIESTTIPISPILNDFIKTEIEYCDRAVKLIPKHYSESSDLDTLFRNYVLNMDVGK